MEKGLRRNDMSTFNEVLTVVAHWRHMLAGVMMLAVLFTTYGCGESTTTTSTTPPPEEEPIPSFPDFNHAYDAARNLANKQKDYKQAGRIFAVWCPKRKAEGNYERDIKYIHSLHWLANCYRKTGKYDEMKPVADEFFALYEKLPEKEKIYPLGYAFVLGGTAGAMFEQGKFAEAERYYRKAVPAIVFCYDKGKVGKPKVKEVYTGLIDSLKAQKKDAEAAEVTKEAKKY